MNRKQFRRKAFMFGILTVFCINMQAQLTIKGEYFGVSSYRDADNKKVGNAKGSAVVFQGSLNVPIYTQKDSLNRLTMWSIAINASYASLNNKNFTEDLLIPEIMNYQAAINYLRPISPKWSLLATIGAGVYMPTTQLSQIRINNVLANVGMLFIRRITSNFDAGIGIAMNNTFGYPMVFPALYIGWNYDNIWRAKVSALNGINCSVGYKLNEKLILNFNIDMNGQMAIVKKDNKDKIFTHQYIVIGAQPEFCINNKISIPITIGFSATRGSYFDDRSISAFFRSMSREYDPSFQIAPYIAGSLNISF